MTPFPTITPAWLSATLSRALDRDITVSGILPVDAPGEGFLAFEAIYAARASDLPAAFILKANLKGGGYGAREAFYYRDIVPRVADAPSPPCFDVTHDAESDAACLLLADLSVTHGIPDPDEIPGFDTCARVVEALADIHAVSWNADYLTDPLFTDAIGDIVGLAQVARPDEIAATCARILDRAVPPFFDGPAADLSDDLRPLVTGLVERWPALMTDRASAAPLTLIHGDPHPWNIFLAPGERPRIFDWELLCRGLPVYDVAYFIIRLALEPARRRDYEAELIPRYIGRLAENGISYDDRLARADYRLSVAANILPPIMWRRPRNLRAVMQVFHDWNCHEWLE